jgi:hypothetical protein
MSKFLLNLLVQISKALVYSKIQFLIRKFFFLISARPPPLFFFFTPTAAHLLPPGLARSDRTGPFSKLVHFLHFKTCPIRPENLSDPVASPTGRRMRARPTRPKPGWRICRKAYSLRLCALWQRRLLSLTSLPCGGRLSAPSTSLPPAISPSPAPVCPSPTTIKGRGAPPGHHHTHPTLNHLLPSLQRPVHRAPPPPIVLHHRMIMSDPPPPPLAVGEAHLHPLFIFPQPR